MNTSIRLLFAILVGVVQLQAANPPTENQGANAMSEKVREESKGLLRLVKFTKTNGQKSNLNGVDVYTMECSAEVAANQDCAMTGFEFGGGWNGTFGALKAQKKASSLDTFNPFGAGYGTNKQLARGAHMSFNTKLVFDLTERGWRTERRVPLDVPFKAEEPPAPLESSQPAKPKETRVELTKIEAEPKGVTSTSSPAPKLQTSSASKTHDVYTWSQGKLRIDLCLTKLPVDLHAPGSYNDKSDALNFYRDGHLVSSDGASIDETVARSPTAKQVVIGGSKFKLQTEADGADSWVQVLQGWNMNGFSEGKVNRVFRRQDSSEKLTSPGVTIGPAGSSTEYVPQDPSAKTPSFVRPGAAEAEDVEQAHTEINAIYKQVMAVLSPDTQKRLRTAQRAWIKNRDIEADRIAREGGAIGGSAYRVDHATALAKLIRERTQVLRGYLRDPRSIP